MIAVMTPETCCGTPRLSSMSDYIDRGQQRARSTSLPGLGAECVDDAGRWAAFGVTIRDGAVAAVGFRTSACVTLIAYCEVAAERVTGLPLGMAIRSLRAADLVEALPAVPAVKRDRALLATRALMSVLVDHAGEMRP